MSQIDPYIISLVYSDRAEFGLGQDFRRAEEVIPLIRKIVREVVVHYGAPESITDLQSVAEKIFNQLISVAAFQSEEHDFAGVYYRFIQNRYNAFRVEHAQKDKIFLTSQRIGPRYFRDVFAGFLGQQKAEDIEAAVRSGVIVPASDRIILSTDNMPAIIDELEDLKKAIDGDNDELGKLAGRRERLVSEITAGQELIKAPSFRLRAVMHVLVTTLGFIAAEFAGGIIGDLAVRLLEQIKPLLGI